MRLLYRIGVREMNMPGRDSVQASLVAVEAQIRAGDLAGASVELGRLRTIAPGDARICLVEAALARSAGESEREMDALQRGVALTPNWPVVRVELAKALSRAGRHDKAVEAANRAVELAPNNRAALEVAVAIANQAGTYPLVERHLRAALALWPNDVGVARGLAMCLFAQRRFVEAEVFYRRVCERAAGNPASLAELGVCLTELGRKAEAIECLEKALERNPGNGRIKFHLAVARGETPSTQPNDVTEEMFDGYSDRFDQHLVGLLKYRVPKRVAEIVHGRRPDRNIDVLDLGCGTGLTGVYLGRVGGAFIGVDLSSRMLERARLHGVYTRLRHGDLRDELRESAAESYDCVIANDVFIYLGDLSWAIPAAFRVLRHGGALIFSCEAPVDEESDFILQPSKRYGHSRSYVERLCREAGFYRIAFENLDLRIEDEVPIRGFIAVAEKS